MNTKRGMSQVMINILTGGFILGTLVVVFFYLKEDDAELLPTQETEVVSQTELEAQHIFNVIDEISSIELRRDVILRSDFANLEDMTVPVPVQQAGTPNPFDKIRF
jgi:hypothetical protein